MSDHEPTAWLLDLLLQGEHQTWSTLAASPRDDLPGPLLALAGTPGQGASTEQLIACSALLRRIAAQQPQAAASVVIASLTILRLSALGHGDPGWAGLLPRWLVTGLPSAVRGLGLLALAVDGRERLAADDYAVLVEEALQLLPRESALRAAHLHQFALYLGLRGMLRRISGLIDLPDPGDPEPEVEPTLLAECLYDAVCCGRTAQAAFLARRIAAAPEAAWQIGLIQLHQVYIPLFAAVVAGSALPLDDAAPSTPVVRALLGDDHHQLDAFVPQADEDEVSPLLGYDTLRVALARRDAVRARQLLTLRSTGLARHWLDDVFLARLLLLEGQPAAAGAAFARVEAAAQRYGALERLEIELRLASELSRHDCCQLGVEAAAGRHLAADVGTPPTARTLADALLAGSSVAVVGLRRALITVRPATDARVLLCGPADGSRSLLISMVHERLGGGALHRLNATSSLGMAELADGLLAAAQGTLVIDGTEYLDNDLQAWLAERLESGLPCRLVFSAGTDLPTVVAAGRWRADLYWPLAATRIRIPSLRSRRDDLGAVASSLVRVLGSQAVCEAQALQAISTMTLAGGWAELRALCALLVAARPVGTIDQVAVHQARAALDGDTAESR